MVVGLGTGSTADYFIEALGAQLGPNLRISAVATSERTTELARSLGIPLIPLERRQQIDLTVDGADEIVRGSLSLLKGRGGALVREKLVAVASRRVAIVADHSKLVDKLGSRYPVPVEAVPFGAHLVAAQLAALGGKPALRRSGELPYITDNGNYLLDVDFGPIDDPEQLADRIKHITGVVDHGLFIGLASEALIGIDQGVLELTRP
jgi:ribose 5-phosphate isomerase A